MVSDSEYTDLTSDVLGLLFMLQNNDLLLLLMNNELSVASIVVLV
jgi:hypothetical protein